MSYVQTNEIIKYVATGAAAFLNITPADSGKTFLIPALGAAHALTVRLPEMKAGLRYRFMATATLASDVTFTPTNGLPPYTPINGLITGSLFNIGDTAANVDGALAANEVVNDVTIKEADNTAVLTADARAGDFIDINSDGEQWIVSGFSSVIRGLT